MSKRHRKLLRQVSKFRRGPVSLHYKLGRPSKDVRKWMNQVEVILSEKLEKMMVTSASDFFEYTHVVDRLDGEFMLRSNRPESHSQPSEKYKELSCLIHSLLK